MSWQVNKMVQFTAQWSHHGQSRHPNEASDPCLCGNGLPVLPSERGVTGPVPAGSARLCAPGCPSIIVRPHRRRSRQAGLGRFAPVRHPEKPTLGAAFPRPLRRCLVTVCFGDCIRARIGSSLCQLRLDSGRSQRRLESKRVSGGGRTETVKRGSDLTLAARSTVD